MPRVLADLRTRLRARALTTLASHGIEVHRTLGGLRGERTEGTRRPVPVLRLDDIAAERALAGPFVVKVDVEGGELEVLSGALDVLRATELVLLEVSLFEFVPGAPQFHDVVS